MLTEKMKNVLDKLVEMYYVEEGTYSIDPSTDIFPTLFPNEVDSILSYLDSEGYIQMKSYIDGCKSIKLTAKGLEYKSFEQTTNSPTQTNIFNGPVSNSVISNTGTVTVNNGISIQEALSFIQSLDIPQADRAEAKEVIVYIQSLAENEVPLKKGLLSKFSDVLSKHSWLPELVAKLAFSYLTGMSI